MELLPLYREFLPLVGNSFPFHVQIKFETKTLFDEISEESCNYDKVYAVIFIFHLVTKIEKEIFIIHLIFLLLEL
jgi:hypothetical protein